MSRKLYIGISGKMGSGKTTLTNGLIKNLTGFKCKRVSLAEPIKKLQDLVYKDLEMEMVGEKDRDLLIALGMWGRGKNDNFWLDTLEKKINKTDTQVIICDDIRFENEAKFFQEKGMLMRITGEQRGDNVDHNTSNETETALDNFNFDYYVDNRHGIDTTLMSALYCIAQHIGVDKEIMSEAARQVKEEQDGR